MINIKINNKEVTVEHGTSILQAANSIGCEIPTMCYDENLPHFTSCMLCVVEDEKTGRLLPSCSYQCHSGMSILTDSEKVKQSRKTALELLLSEHIGDCEGPCTQTCPAEMNIPLMLKQIEQNKLDEAIVTIKNHIALPAILGRICPAPCEKVCRRSQVDETVAICNLKGYVAEWDLKQDKPYFPEKQLATNKKIVIIGAGVTGLSTAWYLLQNGHSVSIYEKNSQPGGDLHNVELAGKLPKQLMQSEIDLIVKYGVEIGIGKEVGKDISVENLLSDFDAIVLASGTNSQELCNILSISGSNRGVNINKGTYQTDNPKIFAGGSVVAPSKMAVKSVAQGREIALCIDDFLKTGEAKPLHKMFNSKIGKLLEIEKQFFQQESKPEKNTDVIENLLQDDAEKEASRCLHCECLKPNNCKLRDLADEYGTKQSHFKGEDRVAINKNFEHDLLIFESGKCIKCGLCIRTTEQSKEKLGLTFIGRGFDVQVGVPLNNNLKQGLTETAKKCVEICPTGALAFRE